MEWNVGGSEFQFLHYQFPFLELKDRDLDFNTARKMEPHTVTCTDGPLSIILGRPTHAKGETKVPFVVVYPKFPIKAVLTSLRLCYTIETEPQVRPRPPLLRSSTITVSECRSLLLLCSLFVCACLLLMASTWSTRQGVVSWKGNWTFIWLHIPMTT